MKYRVMTGTSGPFSIENLCRVCFVLCECQTISLTCCQHLHHKPNSFTGLELGQRLIHRYDRCSQLCTGTREPGHTYDVVKSSQWGDGCGSFYCNFSNLNVLQKLKIKSNQSNPPSNHKITWPISNCLFLSNMTQRTIDLQCRV